MTTSIDEDKLLEVLGPAIVDFGAVSIAPLGLIGNHLGLYRALADKGPATAAELTPPRPGRALLRFDAARNRLNFDKG